MNKGTCVFQYTLIKLTSVFYSEKLHPRIPEYQSIDAWTHSLSNKKPEPIARIRINFDKIFAIHQHDEDPQGSKERRATIAMLQAR